MGTKAIITLLLLSIAFSSCSKENNDSSETLGYPSFGPELEVSINGLTFDAMEPFIAANGNYLFFNNINDGADTKLFYATKVNDSTFTFVGELIGTNQTTASHFGCRP